MFFQDFSYSYYYFLYISIFINIIFFFLGGGGGGEIHKSIIIGVGIHKYRNEYIIIISSLSSRCLGRTSNGTAMLEHLPSPGPS